jgi:rod shape-determining protein MreD
MLIYYIVFPLLLLAAVFDATIMTLLRFWGGSPNLVLMIVVSWALLVDIREALPWAVMGGIMRDLLSVAPTGSSALALVLIVIAIDRFLPKIEWRNIPLPLLTIALATLLYDAILQGLLVIAGWPIPAFQFVTYVILPGLMTNVFLMLIVLRTIGSVNQFLRPPRASLLE